MVYRQGASVDGYPENMPPGPEDMPRPPPRERLLVRKLDFILSFCCLSYFVNYVCARLCAAYSS